MKKQNPNQIHLIEYAPREIADSIRSQPVAKGQELPADGEYISGNIRAYQTEKAACAALIKCLETSLMFVKARLSRLEEETESHQEQQKVDG